MKPNFHLCGVCRHYVHTEDDLLLPHMSKWPDWCSGGGQHPIDDRQHRQLHEQYVTLARRMPAGKFLFTGETGRSPHNFEAYDHRGKRQLVWVLDYQVLSQALVDGPIVMRPDGNWQIEGARADILDSGSAVSGGSPGLGRR